MVQPRWQESVRVSATSKGCPERRLTDRTLPVVAMDRVDAGQSGAVWSFSSLLIRGTEGRHLLTHGHSFASPASRKRGEGAMR
jgi:hypothetical protein